MAICCFPEGCVRFVLKWAQYYLLILVRVKGHTIILNNLEGLARTNVGLSPKNSLKS